VKVENVALLDASTLLHAYTCVLCRGKGSGHDMAEATL